jgi:hypothetical protein
VGRKCTTRASQPGQMSRNTVDVALYR